MTKYDLELRGCNLSHNSCIPYKLSGNVEYINPIHAELLVNEILHEVLLLCRSVEKEGIYNHCF